ncbi:hypothetical protein [Ulvibacter litoralis]|uniref:TonB family C-terminal domain-containing protein n=1 Tax=Ulvibacter litoralis TaxID=227084 RepID=A0A1G7CSF5_9FLAO|nr:hypothetical protein [Ulvibacter litoralis]GHC46216.1 hypothetical protein GCM10008083_06530 [Ulvibacter litoralis]SDE42282.1 hypothetical protein SAMN05421855_101543 [Ulvibacter litoralis]
MNFNYSYRAFLITSLLFGILFLAFKSIKLSKYKVVPEESFDIEYAVIENEVEDDMASVPKKTIKIQTNRAFNEAEKFISEIENEERILTEETDGLKEESASESNESDTNASAGDLALQKKKVSEVKKKTSNGSNKTEKVSVTKSANRNSTVSYRLVNRNVIDLPNPVYTCGSYGKVVINIEVSATGKVVKSKYNEASSTTSNACLIDAALDYADQTRFTTEANKDKQLGSITYNFQGQN